MKNQNNETVQQENERLKKRIDDLERKRFDLDKKIFELKVLYDIARETTTSQDIQTMLKVFLSMTMGTFGISKGLIVIYHDDERGWELVTSRGVDFNLDGSQIELSSFDSLSQKKETWLVNTDFDQDGEFVKTTLYKWLISIPIKVWTPILGNNKVIGGICLGEKISGEDFYDENLNLLSIIATNCALNIRNSRLFQENIEKERPEAILPNL